MSASFKKIFRAVLVRSLMIGGLLGVAVAVGTTPASAKATNAKTVSCAGLRDDGSGTGVLLSQCTGSGLRTTGATGLDIFVSRSRAKVTWSTGKTSLLSLYRYIYPTNRLPQPDRNDEVGQSDLQRQGHWGHSQKTSRRSLFQHRLCL